MVSVKYQKVLYDVSPHDFKILDDDHVYKMSSEINHSISSSSYRHIYWSTVAESGLITQQVSLVILFTILFVHLDTNNLQPINILIINALIGLIGLFLYRQHISLKLLQENFKTLSIFLLFGSLVSPVVFTLTKTISTDTIYAMSTLMMLTHLIFYDYGSETAMVQKALSFSVALFSSVCLASRLSTSFHTFCLVTSAVLVFALWPELRKYIKKSSFEIFSVLTIVHILGCIILLFHLSMLHMILYALAILFLTFLCPLWLISLQKYKISIRGAWEEAVVPEQTKDKFE
ncbi:unnamed protein product [Adineta steineri]|uniref:Phosphatidylinositol N-acetylglucosaminyltransferase subunit C n=1 Tax=Adineta steineri TaxID=433720 RepID=A0A813YCA4_9BILA|nr:unnamed protein product [Adineta steineri]CAF0887993.1 unnamed protein product [Adineta steineri]